VAAVAGAVGDRDAVPGQDGAAFQQVGLVDLDDQQVVLLGYQELGGVGVGVQRVGGDDRPGKVQPVQQGLEGGDLAGVAERGTDWLGSLGGPFGDRGHRAGTGKHRGGGHGHDGDERVAAATRGSRVGDAGQVGEQVRSLGFLERVGIAQRVKTRWDRG
jgi:hypothetical protein